MRHRGGGDDRGRGAARDGSTYYGSTHYGSPHYGSPHYVAILPYLLWQVRFETASVAVRDTLSQLDEVAAHTDAADSQQHRQLQEAEAAATGD